MQRHEACLGAGPNENEDESKGGERGGEVAVADGTESISPVRSSEKAEGKQQRKRAEARHDEIDITSAEILPHLIVCHHQRP